MIEVDSIKLAIPPADEWHDREQSQTREAIVRAASYATQSLIMACTTGFPRAVACGSEIAAIEAFIVSRLMVVNNAY
jgi:hypothetical protein